MSSKTKRATSIHRAVQNAAENLPKDWTITISIERDGHSLELFFDGDCKLFPTNYESLADQINDAVRYAIEKEGGRDE